MAQHTAQFIKDRVILVHAWLLRAGESVSPEAFNHVFSPEGPPIGWHLWHMARFTDRLQAKIAAVTAGSPAEEIWSRNGLTGRWGLDPERLGVFESGMGQAHQDAQETVRRIGQAAVLAYAGDVFAAGNATIGQLTNNDLEKSYHGIMDYAYDGATGDVWATEPRESTVGQDLIFHASHGSRHVGMMEALRGLLGSAGTLSV